VIQQHPDGPQPSTTRRRRIPATVISAVLVLCAAGAGGAYTWIRVSAADRTVTTRIWADPTPQETRRTTPPHRTGDSLTLKLLPVPEYYTLGPDIAGHGNDTEFTGKQAVALFKKGMGNLPREQHRQRSEAVDRLQIRGLAMRTYVNSSDLVLETQIARLADKRAVRKFSTFQSDLTKTFKIFREGPKIKDHDNVHCYLAPMTADAELEIMFCTAHEDDLLITITGYAAKPLNARKAAEFVRNQLNHVASPGEYV
jgi:hypothetical protein